MGAPLPYTTLAFFEKTASIASCSTPNSAKDSRAISYQSPALELAFEAEECDDPKIIRSYPNASNTGPTITIPDQISDFPNLNRRLLTVHLDSPFPFLLLLAL